MAIKFIKSPTPPPHKLAYNVRDVVKLDAALEKKLIEEGYALPATKEEEDLAKTNGGRLPKALPKAKEAAK